MLHPANSMPSSSRGRQFIRENHPDVVRLFADFEAMEQSYYADTRVYRSCM